MAISIGNIIAKMQLNIDNFASNMQKAQDHIQNVEKKFSGFSDIGGRFTSVGNTLTLGVTAPVIGLGTAIANTSANFQAGMSKVQAISGATGEDLQKLKDKAMEMGQKTQFSATEAADAMSYMAMAGWDADKIMSGLSGVMDLSAASGEDLALVSDIVTDAMTAFGLEADKAGSFADILAAASSNANTNVALLGESFKYVAPVAGALGYTAEDTAVALGLMANAGIKGSQGGTALRTALSRLVDPTKEMKALMNEYGISLTNQDGTMKSLGEVMQDLKSKMGGLDEATQAQAATTLFGQEAMSGMLAIINSSDADFEKLQSAIYGADGAANQMATTMNDNLIGKLKLLWSQLETVALKLGETLLPIIEKVVEKITEWVDWFSNLDSSTQDTIIKVALLAAAVGPLLSVVGTAIKTFGKMQENLTLAKDAFTALKNSQVLATAKTKLLAGAQAALNAVMSLNPATWVVIGILALVATFVVLWNKCEAFRNFWIDLWEKIKEASAAVWEWLKEIGSQVVESVTATWEGFKTWWSDTWTFIKDKASEFWNWIVEMATGLWNSVVDGWNSFKDGVASVWQSIVDTVIAWKDKVIEVVLQMVDNLMSNFSGTISALQGMWEGFKTYFEGWWEVLKNLFLGAILLICDLVTGDFEQLKEDALAIWENLKEGFSKIWEGITQFFTESLNAFVTFWQESWEAVSRFFSQIWESIKTYCSETWEWLKTTISEAWTNMVDTIKTKLDEMKQWVVDKWESIKTYLWETWESVKTRCVEAWQNMVNTIKEKLAEIKNWVVTKWNEIVEWLKSLPSTLKQIGSDMFNKMKDGITSTVDKVKTAVVDGVTKAVDWLKDLPNQAVTWGRHMIEGFIDGIKAAVGKLKDAVVGVAQSIRDVLGFTVPKKGPLHVYMEWMPHMMEGMRDTLNAHKYKLLDAAEDVAGGLSDSINGPLDEDRPTSSSSESKQKTSEERTVQYNINIERVDANNADDVRKLAEGLEAIRRQDEL